jgi:hypothetical protein
MLDNWQIKRNRYPLLFIYAAIDDLKDAMEGIAPEMKEEVLGTAIREIFKISKVLLQVVW